MKTCLIRQPAGLGDILFCLKIAHIYKKEMGYDVIWPIQDAILKDIKKYITLDVTLDFSDSLSRVPIYSTKQVQVQNKLLYLPLQDASHSFGEPIMEAKYRMAKLSSDNYLNYFNLKRDKEKEYDLFYNVLGLEDKEPFVLTNRIYATPPGSLLYKQPWCHHIPVKEINMSILPGFSLFDWCKVIENAQEIHTVGTSITFLVEKLNPIGNLYMYRRPEAQLNNFEFEKQYFNRNWKYISQ